MLLISAFWLGVWLLPWNHLSVIAGVFDGVFRALCINGHAHILCRQRWSVFFHPQFCFYLFLGLELPCEFCHDCRSVCWRQASCLVLDLKGEDPSLLWSDTRCGPFMCGPFPLKWSSSVLILLNAFITKGCRITSNALSTWVEITLTDFQKFLWLYYLYTSENF